MPDFKFEDCLLKHYIRKDVWTPLCRRRLKAIRGQAKSKKYVRRLKYFTFCAVGALDVLLLDREKVIRQSNSGHFDTVVFFDRDELAVSNTSERIPGAIGFPGDFISVVLLEDDDPDESDYLNSPTESEDEKAVWKDQLQKDMRRTFISHFPFDVINLDVEQYLFRPSEDLPGKLVNVIRQILDWQKRKGMTAMDVEFAVESFDLMFTTKIGPPNLPDNYLGYLKGRIDHNLGAHVELHESFENRSGTADAEGLFASDFNEAFKIAIPKSLADLVLESDWYIDDASGIQIYEFNRETEDEPYTMLHMVMTVHRQDPPLPNRAPGEGAPDAALGSHIGTIQKVFSENVIDVENIVTGEKETALKDDLQRLFKHRDRYLNATDAN